MRVTVYFSDKQVIDAIKDALKGVVKIKSDDTVYCPDVIQTVKLWKLVHHIYPNSAEKIKEFPNDRYLNGLLFKRLTEALENDNSFRFRRKFSKQMVNLSRLCESHTGGKETETNTR